MIGVVRKDFRRRVIVTGAAAALVALGSSARSRATHEACDCEPGPAHHRDSAAFVPSPAAAAPARVIRPVVSAPAKRPPAARPVPSSRRRPAKGPAKKPPPSREVFVRGVPIGTTVRAAAGELRLTLVARIRNYEPGSAHPEDRTDPDVFSPKSVRFMPGGDKVYVNALEGLATLAFDPATLAKRAVIRHRFGTTETGWFPGSPPFDYTFPARPRGVSPDLFTAKPVEMELTHGGRYLWVPYYRRDWDTHALWPSAVAVIDTATDTIARMLHTGPIPKYVVASPRGDRLAIIHWGDNTVGFVDITAPDAAGFALRNLVTVGWRLNLNGYRKSGKKINRDKVCGACLRGAVFTADGKWLLVARMAGGGIAVIDVEAGTYVGTMYGMRPTPRHLVLRGDRLYVSSNTGGAVSWFPVDAVVAAARAERKADRTIKPSAETLVGYGVRTIAVSPDGRWVYAAVNSKSKLAVLRADDLGFVAEIPVDSFPVGLDVSPDGSRVWVTSQGRDRRGGNAVSIYAVETPSTLLLPPAVAGGTAMAEPAGATILTVPDGPHPPDDEEHDQ